LGQAQHPTPKGAGEPLRAEILIRAKPPLRYVAKHTPKRRGRKFRRYLRGKVEKTLDLGTLASKTLVSVNLDGSVEERTWISSVKATWSLSDFTNAIGDGPIAVGIAHSDYTDTEIEQWLETTNSWKEGDLVNQEIAKRKIRLVGTFKSSVADSQGIAVLNDGKPITTKLNFILNTGQTVSIWAYNQGDSALATTDPDMSVIGQANLWPR